MDNKVNQGSLLLKYAMSYGVILGIFWVIKYLFVIAGEYSSFFLFINNMLVAGTLLIYYVLLRRYRDQALDGKINYGQCISFSVLLFFFAGLIEAVIIYIHYSYIDPTFVTENIEKPLFEVMKTLKMPDSYINMMANQVHSNFYYVVNSILGNVLVGFFLSLIYGIFVRRKPTHI